MREQIKNIANRIWGDPNSTENFLIELDLIIEQFIGEDDTENTVVPHMWNDSLKKQYINFRNHLRRSMRAKWREKDETSE